MVVTFAEVVATVGLFVFDEVGFWFVDEENEAKAVPSSEMWTGDNGVLYSILFNLFQDLLI